MSSTYTCTRDQIITAALRKVGILEPADNSTTIDPNIVTNTAVTFNLLVKQMQSQGVKLWTIENISVPYTVSKTSYIIGPSGPDVVADKPLRLIQAWLQNNQNVPNTTTPLMILSEKEYNELSSPNSSGVTNSVFLKVGLNTSTVFVYLTPDTNTSTNYVLYLSVQRSIQDMYNSTDNPDFPIEWYNPLTWMIADEIAIEWDVSPENLKIIQMKAAQYRKELEDWDVEQSASVYFQPDMRMRGPKW